MKKFAYENKFDTISFIQNNSVQYENYSICGTRGWSIKSSEDPKLNEKIFDREKKRLILSLEDAKKKSSNEIIAALHYPPVEKDSQNKDFIDILNEYGVKICFYGHIHAQSIKNAVTGDFGGIELRLVSCDSVGFTPVLLK